MATSARVRRLMTRLQLQNRKPRGWGKRQMNAERKAAVVAAVAAADQESVREESDETYGAPTWSILSTW